MSIDVTAIVQRAIERRIITTSTQAQDLLLLIHSEINKSKQGNSNAN